MIKVHAEYIMVKNSRLGPLPSMAGSPSNLTFNVFLKSKFLCLKWETLSAKIEDRLTVRRVGESPGRGYNACNTSLTHAHSFTSCCSSMRK